MNGTGMCEPEGPKSLVGMGYRQPTITENLTMRRDSMVQQLADVEAALAAIQKNPEVQAAFDAIAKVSGIR